MTIKKIISFALCLFSLSAFSEKPVLHIIHWDLKNKTRVFFVRRTELPMLDVAMVFSAGSAYDGNQPGIATLANSMLDEGTKNASADQIAENFENVGAQFRLFANRDMAGMTLRTLINPHYLQPALQNFANIVNSPTFPNTSLNRVKQGIIAQIKSQQQDPSNLASNRFYELIYGNNSYAHNPLGNSTTLTAITHNQLTTFYEKYYTGANANLILVGDLTDQQAKDIAMKIAGNLPEGAPAPSLPLAPNTDKTMTDRINHPSSQSTLIIGQVGINRENHDYFPLILDNAVLGGLPMSSILYNEVREKEGLAYSVTSAFNPLRYRGPFMVYLQTKATTVDQADTTVTHVLKKFIEEGPTESQLSAAKHSLISSLPLTLSSNQSILSAVTNIAFYHRSINFFDTYEKNINAVTTQQGKTAFQNNINIEKMVTVIAGEKK
jgi:zinc protease